jgi:hypothetical protein
MCQVNKRFQTLDGQILQSKILEAVNSYEDVRSPKARNLE